MQLSWSYIFKNSLKHLGDTDVTAKIKLNIIISLCIVSIFNSSAYNTNTQTNREGGRDTQTEAG